MIFLQLPTMKNSIFLLLLLPLLFLSVGAQPGPPSTPNNDYPYARFSPSMAIIIVVLIAALFFMGFFSIYIRHCSDSSGAAGSIRRALSFRSRRAAAARGLDASVIESFPTFSYSEVKDHKIGKGTLECAVCLNEFEEEETLRLLPKCDHVFHPECIDAWLESHVTCPVCRANLAEPTAAAADDPLPESSPAVVDVDRYDNLLEATGGSSSSRSNNNDEVVVQVIDNDGDGQRVDNPNPDQKTRSWSIRMPKVAGVGKFRSHSTGHSLALVQPGENLERFTLRLPERVRKEVMDRASLNRTGSLAAVSLQRQGSSSRARFYRRIEREGKSDRWVFFSRGMSVKSPKAAAAEGGAGEGSSRGPVKLPSLKCLEPKAAGDETGLVSATPTRFE